MIKELRKKYSSTLETVQKIVSKNK